MYVLTAGNTIYPQPRDKPPLPLAGQQAQMLLCTQVKDPSLLRFLVDLRDADLSDRQLRDDLMTMLIAGHETTAAVLTWALHCLVQHPEELAAIRAEVDAEVGDSHPGTLELTCMQCSQLCCDLLAC